MAGNPIGFLENSYLKTQQYPENLGSRTNKTATPGNAVKLYINKDKCCECGEDSLPFITYTYSINTETSTPFIVLSIDTDNISPDAVSSFNYIIKDESGNEVWTGRGLEKDSNNVVILDLSNLNINDNWFISFTVIGIATGNGCTPKLSYTTELGPNVVPNTTGVSYSEKSVFDFKVYDFNISAAGAGVNTFTFKVKSETEIPLGAVVPVIMQGQPTDTYTLISISGSNLSIVDRTLVATDVIPKNTSYTVTCSFANATPISGTAILSIVDSVEKNNFVTDTYS